jgi:uncharacterized protein YndB with AHSA1/START domain
METKEHIAKAAISINAPVQQVWDALINPALIKQYMFGTEVQSNWQPGSSITWKGEFNGKPYEDEGKILKLQPNEILQYSHKSGNGEEHTVTIQLTNNNEHTGISLTQDKNADENAKQASEKNWNAMLTKMKELLEN